MCNRADLLLFPIVFASLSRYNSCLISNKNKSTISLRSEKMKHLACSSIMPFLLAVSLGIVLLLRGVKHLNRKYSERYILALVCVALAFSVYPVAISAAVLRVIHISFFMGVGILLIVDISIELYFKARTVLGKKRRVMPQIPDYIKELYSAMQRMASRHLGALILLEKKDVLQDSVGSGLAFESDVKADILVALFEKNSPVHDGALIIKNGSIAMVKAILPIKTRAPMPLGVGTRHRAAIGITEHTDCIALIVSEERSEISIAYEGALIKPASDTEFFTQIWKCIKAKSPREKKNNDRVCGKEQEKNVGI